MVKQKTILTVFILFATFISFANERWTHFTTENTSTTLSNNNVYCVSIDTNGVKWFGTAYGLTSFDGVNWKHYTHKDGMIGTAVYAVCVDKYNIKWVGTDSGLLKFDDIRWTHIKNPDETQNGNILQIIIDKHNVKWFSTGFSIISYTESVGFKKYQLRNPNYGDDYINSLAIDSENNIYIGATGNLYKFSDPMNISIFSSGYCAAVAVKTDGTIIADKDGILSKYDGKSWIPYQNMWSVKFIKNFNDDIWFGRNNQGVYKISGTIGDEMYFKHRGILSDNVNDIAIERNGDIWIATDRGVSKVSDKKITNYEANGLISNRIYSIAIDILGNKWFATDLGVSIFDGNVWKSFQTSSELMNSEIRKILIDRQNNIWCFHSYEGASIYNGLTWRKDSLKSIGLNYYSSFVAEVDKNGLIWTYTNSGGLYYYDGIKWIHNYEGSTYGVKDIIFDKIGNLWTINNSGVSMYDGNKVRTYDLGTSCSAIVADTSNLIIVGSSSYYQNISTFNGLNWTKDTSLFNITDLITDSKNIIWGICDDGLLKHDSIWRLIKYNKLGVKLNGGNNLPKALAIDKSGNKWIGTYSDGVYMFNDGGASLSSDISSQTRISYFIDENANGKLDANEPPVKNQILKIDPFNRYISTGGDGNVIEYNSIGTKKITALRSKYFRFTTDSIKTTTTTIDKYLQDTFLIGVTAKNPGSNLAVSIIGSRVRPFFKTNYWINYKNIGSINHDVIVTMKYDSLLSFISSSLQPTKMDDSILTWNIPSVDVMTEGQIKIQFQVAERLDITGKAISANAAISSAIKQVDIDSTDNTSTFSDRIVNSLDPNDKHEQIGFGDKGFTLHNTPLNYTIRFQNTGTDTAYNVVIHDTLSSYLDINSLEIKNSSHNLTFEIKPDRDLVIYFKNINLVDSCHNEPASHGFVSYRINPVAQLEENTKVTNKAGIYFDYNLPVLTNTTINTFVTSYATDLKKIATKNACIDNQPPLGNDFGISSLISQNSKIQLFNITGSPIWSNETVVASDIAIPSGMYILKIENRNGETCFKKIIINQ